jgi:hypothetical protein
LANKHKNKVSGMGWEVATRKKKEEEGCDTRDFVEVLGSELHHWRDLLTETNNASHVALLMMLKA